MVASYLDEVAIATAASRVTAAVAIANHIGRLTLVLQANAGLLESCCCSDSRLRHLSVTSPPTSLGERSNGAFSDVRVRGPAANVFGGDAVVMQEKMVT